MMKMILCLLIVLFNCIFILPIYSQNAILKPQAIPVKLDNEVILEIRNGIGGFSPQERADNIQKKIYKLASSKTFDPTTLRIEQKGNESQILTDDLVLLSFSQEDEASFNKPVKLLAEESIKKIQQTMKDYRDFFSLKTIVLGIVYSFLVTILLFFLINNVNKIINHIYQFIIKLQTNNVIKSLKFQKLELLSSKKIELFLKFIIVISNFIVIALLIYYYIVVILSFFPWTQSHSAMLRDNINYFIGKIFISIASYIPNLLAITLIITIAVLIIKFFRFICNEIKIGNIEFTWFYKEWADTTYNIIKFLVICITIAMIYPYLPFSDSNAFKGVSIFVGLLLSLGSTSIISNVIAGVVLTYTRAFDIGERVQIGSYTGDIIEKTMFVLRIRTLKNELISIPNSKAISSEIINYSALSDSEGLILHTEITIGYDIPWPKVHELLILAAKDTEHVFQEKEPFVLQKALNDYSVSYELNVFTKRADINPYIYSNLHLNIQNRFNEANIEIMSPQYSSIRDGNKITIPNQYLKEDYKESRFKVAVDSEPSVVSK